MTTPGPDWVPSVNIPVVAGSLGARGLRRLQLIRRDGPRSTDSRRQTETQGRPGSAIWSPATETLRRAADEGRY